MQARCWSDRGTGICHTDGLARHGDLPFPFPGVLGHEGAGRGRRGRRRCRRLRRGRRGRHRLAVVRRCRNCRAGEPRYCARLGEALVGGRRLDGAPRLRRTDGSTAREPLLRAVVVRHVLADDRAARSSGARRPAARADGPAGLRRLHRCGCRLQHRKSGGRREHRRLRRRHSRSRRHHGGAQLGRATGSSPSTARVPAGPGQGARRHRHRRRARPTTRSQRSTRSAAARPTTRWSAPV